MGDARGVTVREVAVVAMPGKISLTQVTRVSDRPDA
jgi:hypothetical protein